MRIALLCRAVVPVLALVLPACRSTFEGGGDLRAQKVVLKREVEGLREAVPRLEKEEPIFPSGDVAIAIDDRLLRDIISAQLPFEMEVDRFHLSLTEVEAQFRGSPVVRLRGALHPRDKPTLVAAVSVIGALEGVEVDQANLSVQRFVSPEEFASYRATALDRGFLECVAGPLVRSSYRAEQALARNNAGLGAGGVATR